MFPHDRSDWERTVADAGVVPLPGASLVAAARVTERLRFAGTLDGRAIAVVITDQYVVAQAAFDPPFDLELAVRPEGTWPPRGDLTLDDPRFDPVFVVAAAEPDRAAMLLDGAVRAALCELFAVSAGVTLDDESLRVVGEGTAWLAWALPRTAALARRLDHRRGLVPVPASLRAVRASLARFASDHLLRIDDTPVRIAGTTGVVAVQVRLLPSRHRPVLEARLLLADALNLELRIEPQTIWTPLRARLPGGGADHLLGDPAFDSAFWVRARYPTEAAHGLDAPARALLSACAEGARTLVLDDQGLTLEAHVDPTDPGGPAARLRTGIQLLERLHERLRSGPSAGRTGPFR